MAQITTIGQVQCVKVGTGIQFPVDEFGFVQIVEQGTNLREIFTIWYNRGPLSHTAKGLLQIVQESLLREALTNRLQVRIDHEETSNAIDAIEVDAPTGL